MIRHGDALLLAAMAVCTLAVAMIEGAFQAALVALIGATPLLASGVGAALRAAVAMSAIAVLAEEEGSQTLLAWTYPLQQDCAVRRHASAGGLDNGTRFVSV
jgi:hypothetical protein